MDVSDARKLKVLEDENAKLKTLLAEAMLDNAMVKDVAKTIGDVPLSAMLRIACRATGARREASTHLYTARPYMGQAGCLASEVSKCLGVGARLLNAWKE